MKRCRLGSHGSLYITFQARGNDVAVETRIIEAELPRSLGAFLNGQSLTSDNASHPVNGPRTSTHKSVSTKIKVCHDTTRPSLPTCTQQEPAHDSVPQQSSSESSASGSGAKNGSDTDTGLRSNS